jgi:hypothetical protein
MKHEHVERLSMPPELQELYNQREDILQRIGVLAVQLTEVSAAYNQAILDNINNNRKINEVENWNG